jgi:hypothetical protein
MNVKVNDNRTNNKEIAKEIEIHGIRYLPCEMTIFDTYTRIEVHQTYLLEFEFEAIVTSMSLHGYQFHGLNFVKDAIHFVFNKTEKHDNITM